MPGRLGSILVLSVYVGRAIWLVKREKWRERGILGSNRCAGSRFWRWARGPVYRGSKGLLGHAFMVRIRTGNQNQTSFYHSVPHDIFVLVELILGHLHYLLTDVPPQPNSPPDNVFHPDQPAEGALGPKRGVVPRFRSRNQTTIRTTEPPNSKAGLFPQVIPPDLESRSECLRAKGSWGLDARWAIAATTKRVEIQPPFVATFVHVDSHLGQPRPRVKKLEFGLWDLPVGPPMVCIVHLIPSVGDVLLALTGRGQSGAFVFHSQRLNYWIYEIRTNAKAFSKNVFINQERELGAQRRSDTVLVSIRNDADQGSVDIAFRTSSAPYEKSKFFCSGGNMVASLKLTGIGGRALPGVGPAA
ncbi:Regulator of rDNA transcription protein 15 [Capsicum chinense]|nr:Regulator of rDNA transcription protein 15 [Capsicum chinense]